MATSTDYWLQGMQVANADQKDYLANQQKNRDYLTKNKLYYGEDWVGDEKGNTDFRASELARKKRIAEDANAAAEVYLGGPKSPASTTTDPRAAYGMSESDADFGAPKAATVSPVQPDEPRYIPVQGTLGSPSAVPVANVRVVTPPKLANVDYPDNWPDSLGEGPWNRDEVKQWFVSQGGKLKSEDKSVIQQDAPDFVPVQDNIGTPAPVVTAPIPVAAPPIGNDFGASLAPSVPVRTPSPVPNTSTFGAPLQQPTAREIFDRTDPVIRDNPHFRTALAAYEKDRLTKVAHLEQAEALANIRAKSAYDLLGERTKAASELSAERDKRILERQNDRQEFEKEKYEGLEHGRNERYSSGLKLKKDLANLKVKAQSVGAPKIVGADDSVVKEAGRQLANKNMAADVMENALGIIEDPKTDPAVAYAEAQSLYKAINSADFRSDAVNGEEAKRIGQLLDLNLNPVKIIQTGRVLPSLELYKQQVRDNVNRIRKESDALNTRIGSIYAKYGWDYQGAKPLGSAPSPSSGTSTNAVPKVLTINGKKVTFTP